MALINENRKPLDIELMTGKKQTPEEKEKETKKTSCDESLAEAKRTATTFITIK